MINIVLRLTISIWAKEIKKYIGKLNGKVEIEYMFLSNLPLIKLCYLKGLFKKIS